MAGSRKSRAQSWWHSMHWEVVEKGRIRAGEVGRDVVARRDRRTSMSHKKPLAIWLASAIGRRPALNGRRGARVKTPCSTRHCSRPCHRGQGMGRSAPRGSHPAPHRAAARSSRAAPERHRPRRPDTLKPCPPARSWCSRSRRGRGGCPAPGHGPRGTTATADQAIPVRGRTPAPSSPPDPRREPPRGSPSRRCPHPGNPARRRGSTRRRPHGRRSARARPRG